MKENEAMDDKGLSKEWKRGNCPDPEGGHNVLVDAKWNLKFLNQSNNVQSTGRI